MPQSLFDRIDRKGDPLWGAKEFFNSIYDQGRFLWALPLLVEKKGCGVNEDFCHFPDQDDLEDFGTVTFGSFDYEVTISESECKDCVDLACKLYLNRHPADAQLVKRLLGTSKLASR